MIEIPSKRNDLEQMLREWIQKLLDHIGQKEPMGGVHPASYLTANADGIDDLLYAPAGIGSRTVYADFTWGGRPNGGWFIRHVKFALHLSRAELNEVEKRELKERLLDQAESENAQHFHARQTLFPAEQYLSTWADEIRQGNHHLEFLIEDIYEQAKEEASIPKNWVRPIDIAVGFAGDIGAVALKSVQAGAKMAKTFQAAGASKIAYGVGTIGAEGGMRSGDLVSEGVELTEKAHHMAEAAEHAEKYGKAFEGVHAAHFAYDEGKELKEEFSGEEEEALFKQSGWDTAAGIALDVTSFIPGAGGLVKSFAAMFIEIGLANYSGIVAKIRGRVYSCFVGGFITGLTLSPPSTLKHERDVKYYELGVKRALALSSRISFQYQIALLNYAMLHYTSGFWAGTTPELHGRQAWRWNYPDDWEAKWSPILLGQSMVTMLGSQHYMIGDDD
jgi:hypothetical protein